MKPSRFVLGTALAALFVAGSVQAQLLAPPEPTWQATAPAARTIPTFPALHLRTEGLPPDDPLAPDIWRPDLKLYAGVDLNSVLGIETSFTNPGYTEGMHYRGTGPRLAESIPLGVGGFDLKTAARLTVPVDDRLSAFGTLGVLVHRREHHDVGTTSVSPVASVGANYKLNSRQTVTAEMPLGPVARKAISGAATGLGGSVKLGF